MWACIVEEVEESRVKSAEKVENKQKEGGARWRSVDVWQELGGFALVCVAHGKVEIFQGAGVEILPLDW